jgi:hypothetical protein
MLPKSASACALEHLAAYVLCKWASSRELEGLSEQRWLRCR